MSGLPAGRRRFDESGSVAYELVLLVPVLVLLTLFVLWAGRGGRAELSADLAAEEAATAASLCCEEGDAGEPDREVLVEEILETRPGLEFLCVGGLRPQAPPDSGADLDFVTEHWLDFEPAAGVRTGGVGILSVQFECETDGAVAPLRGLFPTVTFHAQASEVVARRPPPPNIGFQASTFRVNESVSFLPFVVTSSMPAPQDIRVDYLVSSVDPDLNPQPLSTGSVTMTAGSNSVEITVALAEDETPGLYEGTETLTLELEQLWDPTTNALLSPSIAELDPNRLTATGEVLDDDPAPFFFLHAPSPCRVTEGNISVSLEVRLRNEDNNAFAPSASGVTVNVATTDGTATAGDDYTALSTTETFSPGDTVKTVTVQILDDASSPQGEPDETFTVALSGSSGAPLGSITEVTCEIVDDEVRVRVTDRDVTVVEGNQLTFSLSLDRDPSADITVDYRLVDHGRAAHSAQRGAACDPNTYDDYEELTGSITIAYPHDRLQTVDLPAVTTCDDVLVEFDETFWLEISIPSGGGEAVVVPGEGAIGRIEDDDTPTVSITADPAATGTEGQADPLRFTVSLTVGGQPAQLTQNITVDYAVGGGTATAPGLPDADYAITLDTATPPLLSGATLSGTLTFTAGPPAVTEHVFEAELLADYLVEGNETFVVDLDNLIDPIGVAVFEDRDSDPNTDDSHIEATIVEDPPPALSVGDFSGSEGTDQNFTVTLANPRADTVTVDYAIAGTGAYPATDPAVGVTLHDYTAASGSLTGTLTFPDGTPQHSVGVSLRRDVLTERDETLRLVLSNPQRAVLADRDPGTNGVQAYGEGTIVNEDAPLLFVDNTSAREGEPLTFTLTLCNPIAAQDVRVRYQTQARSAAAGRDFTAIPADPNDALPTITFPASMPTQRVTSGCGAGVTADAKSLTVDVATLSDLVEESGEEVHLVLSDQAPDHIGLGKAIGVGRIINVSAATVRVSNPTAVEGDSLGFVISLKDETGGLVGDRAPGATITQQVRVYYATQDRTATAGDDYTPVPAVPGPCLTATPPPTGCPFVEFDPNDNVRDLPVAVTTATDNLDEDDETVALVLRLAEGTANAGLGDAEGTGTIEDAEPPSIRIEDAAAQEGDTLTFAVTLVDADGNPATTSEVVTVDAATYDGTATHGLDYTSEYLQVTIPAGDTSASVPVEVATSIDNINEPPETFRVVLSGARNAKVDKAVAVGTINEPCVVEAPVPADLADNMPPTIALHDVAVVEGASGFAWLASFGRPMCVGPNIEMQVLSGGGFGTATCGLHRVPGGDFPPLGSSCQPPLSAIGRLIQSATTVPTSTVRHGRLWDDDLDEDNEWYTIRIRWGPDMPGRFPKADSDWVSARVTIIDDDPPPHLSIADSSAEEGVLMAFTINLSSESGRPVTVEYRTVPESGAATGSTDRDAAAGVDYTAVGWTSVTLIPGVTSQNFGVTTVHDGAADSGETFLVEVRAPVSSDPANPAPPLNAAIVDGVAVGTILEGNLPELRIRDASADENSIMEFLVELSEPATQAVTVDYSTVERPANLYAADASVDYTGVSASLEIPVGATTPIMPISVVILADSVTEVDETFLVELSNPSGAELADPSAVGTINGDTTCVDTTVPGTPPPIVTVDSPTALESDGEMIFTLTITDPICHRNVFTPYATAVPPGAADRALPDIDFHSSSQDLGIFYLPRLTTQVSFPVYLINDTIDEPDETLAVDIISADTLGDATATGVIVDDDQASLSVASDSGQRAGS